MTLFIGADHRGIPLKNQLVPWLTSQGQSIVDLDSPVFDPVDDFPDISFAVADRVIATPDSLGIILCGSGGGVEIAANKVKGIRAATGLNPADVVHNREHNDLNVLAIAADFTSFDEAKRLVDAFLKTPFDSVAPRFQRRLAKIAARETI